MPDSEPAYEWMLPGLLLAVLALAVHSIGDFNLQIPATTWLLGILAGLAVAIARHTPPFRSRRETSTRQSSGETGNNR